MVFVLEIKVYSTKACPEVAKAERSVRRVWLKAVEWEEAIQGLVILLKEGVGTAEVEAISQSKAEQERRVRRERRDGG
jgi:hypothetical protein